MINPKSEYRNPKQFSNDQNSSFENLSIRKFGFVSNFGFRASDLSRGIRYDNKQGFTLVEIMVVVAIFTIMLGAIYTAFGSGRISYNTQETQVSVQQEIRKAITRMTKELRQAGSVTISTTLTANDTITFQIPTGFDANGNILWSSSIQYNRGGLNNLQIIRTQSGQSEVVANDISALAFGSPGADIVSINLTASKTSLTQTPLQFSLTARVRLRN